MSNTFKSWGNLVLLIATLVVNALGAMGFINGLSQKEVSDMYNTAITPAPSTFEIWSVIYILLIISVLTMIIKKNDDYYRNAVERISVPFWISCFLNMGWIVCFSYDKIALSTVFIIAFVLDMIVILNRLERMYKSERQILRVTFGIYTGWLIIASAVNIAALIVKSNGGEVTSGSISAPTAMIIMAILVRIIMFFIRNSMIALPVAWAYLGIHKAAVLAERSTSVSETAMFGAIVLFIMFLFLRYKNRKKWR